MGEEQEQSPKKEGRVIEEACTAIQREGASAAEGGSRTVHVNYNRILKRRLVPCKCWVFKLLFQQSQ